MWLPLCVGMKRAGWKVRAPGTRLRAEGWMDGLRRVRCRGERIFRPYGFFPFSEVGKKGAGWNVRAPSVQLSRVRMDGWSAEGAV